MERMSKLFERAKRYSVPNPFHGVKVKVEIMQRVKGASTDLSGEKQMAKIGPGKVPARVASAGRIRRLVVFGEAGVLDADRALAREELAVSCVSCRQHTVEHVDPARHAFDEIEGCADAHEVSGLRLRQQRGR